MIGPGARTTLTRMPGMPPDPEWSRLERLVLPLAYHGLSIQSAVVFTVWSFVVFLLTGSMSVLSFTTLDAPVAGAVLAAVSLWCGLAGEALRRHSVRLRRHARWRRGDPE